MGAPFNKGIKNVCNISTEQPNNLSVENISNEQSNTLPVENNYSFIMLGSTFAGKTTLINSLINNKFVDSIESTIGCDYSTKYIKINDKENIKLVIWDASGKEVSRKANSVFIKNRNIHVIVFDVRRKEEMNDISYFLNQIKQMDKDYKEKPIFLIGNKCEKNNNNPRQISKEIAEDFASKNNLFYFEVSSKRIRTLQKTFYIMMNIANDILKNKKKKSEIKIEDYDYDDDSELIDNLIEEVEIKDKKIKSLEYEITKKNDEKLDQQKKLSELENKELVNNENEKINQKILNENAPIDKMELKIKEELTEEKNKNKLLNNKINELNEKIKEMQKKRNGNNTKIDVSETELKIKEELNEEKNKNKLLNSKINELNGKINDLQKITNKNDNMVNTLQLFEKIREKEKEIKEIKSNLPFDISKGEKLMSVIFVSDDQRIHYSIICKNTDKFNRLENILYNVDEYKSYLQSENYFLLNGKKINKYLTLEENGIKNSDIITLMKYEDN